MAHRPVVLLVDDDPSMRELLATMFSMHGGFRIGGVAADGFEGAMLAADVEPDLVVLDFFMPRWDGSKAAAFIRERCPRTKIVAFSAVLQEPPDWADDFLVKNDVMELIPLAEQIATAA
ncbi:MAG TPA: response regulator transcription factor [Actinomycetota bacterium]|nr:response regulator transcription factor [Actinomycetota bacterium]